MPPTRGQCVHQASVVYESRRTSLAVRESKVYILYKSIERGAIDTPETPFVCVYSIYSYYNYYFGGAR